MDDLIYVFRLASGTGVEWYYGETYGTRSETPVERVHKYVRHGPFSGLFRTLVPNPDFPGLAEAFFDERERALHWDMAKRLINAYVSACDSALPLEQRGLLASTLTELLVAQFLNKKEIGDVIPKGEYDGTVLPIVRNAINEIDLCQEWKQQVINNLQNAYRRSFRQCLKLLVDGLDLHLEKEMINRVIDIRNELVHRVTYPTQFEKWSNDYRLVIWIDFIVLCRLMGYRGDLPDLHQDWELRKLI